MPARTHTMLKAHYNRKSRFCQSKIAAKFAQFCDAWPGARKKRGRVPHSKSVVPVIVRGGISRSRLTLDTQILRGHLALNKHGHLARQ